ncbi:MAG: 3-hydroxyacyl-CoA dehydrogenase NAD-binding domain-containing protein [Granulosicoccus sp.]
MTGIILYQRHGDIVSLGANNPPVNALSHAVRDGLLAELDRAIVEGAKAVLIYGIGSTWFAGADIKEFGKPSQAPILPDVCSRIESANLLVVAAIHGTAFGGGVEVALSAHYRIADKSTKFGFPEVTLGLIPGSGGTQRLPRLTGIDVAVDMITGGRPINATHALDIGLLDKITEGDPLTFGLEYARHLLSQNAIARPVSDLPAPESTDFDTIKQQVQRKARGQLSPSVALDAIKAACDLPFKEGMAEERRLFLELMETDQRKGLIHAFFSERQVAKLPELQGVTARNVQSLGVIGGGTMGAGIATAALLNGLSVSLIEMTEEAASKGHERIVANLQGALKRGKLSQSAFDKASHELLNVSCDYNALATADVIIEAVFEDMAVKKVVFGKIDSVAKRGAVLATNTSYLDVNDIAAVTTRPEDVIGMHFFSPAHVMKLLEVVDADATSAEVLATSFALGKRMKKTAVRAGVCDGFIGNRMLLAYRSAADHMILDGASPFDIDRAIEAFGFAMGPYAVSDLAGLDIGWANRKRLASTRDPRERIPTYADKLCEAGHFGRKTGKGYYVYDGKGRTPNPDVQPLIDTERGELGITTQSFSDDDIIARCLSAMVNEAARILDEGIARRPLDIDVVFLLGYGFPRFHGGPMKWADLHGLSALLANIERFAQKDDFFWQPAPLLQKLVADGQQLDDLNQ